ncbi:MAG: exodeoxyribonuclease VII small subunit [Candidatus Muiribacteriota bacterium]
MAKKKETKFEEALAQLEEIAQDFEEGEIGLEDCVEKFKKGSELLNYCEKKLNEAEGKIYKILGKDKEEEIKK